LGAPLTVRGSFQGTAKAFQDALGNQPLLILSALVAVYLVLGILYESLVHPLTILSTLPSAGVGALLALLATGQDFTIIALVGGLFLSQLLTLYTTPVMYLYLDRFRLWGKARLQRFSNPLESAPARPARVRGAEQGAS